MKRLFSRREPQASAEQDAIEGERSVASVNKGLGIQTRLTNLLIGTTVIALVCILLFRYYASLYDKHQQAQAAARKDANHTVATDLPRLTAPVFAEAAAAPAPAAATTGPAPASPASPANRPASGADGHPIPTPAQRHLERQLQAGVFFKRETASAGSAAAEAAGTPPQPGDERPGAIDGPAPAAGGGDPLSRSLQAARFSGARARLLPDPSLMITMGAAIACTVIPAIDTDLPGIVTCIQKEDVYSADRKVLLLERGTKWIGQQKSGMAQGQRRVGILWTRGETPNHVLIDVDSAAGDALGRAGIAGDVDTHFWDRFGAAIMLSLISDVGTYLAATQQNGGGSNNTTIAFPTTVMGAQNVMGDVLKSTLGIPPTLTRNQGADITIYVARDLDFRDVYDIQARRHE